MDCQKSNSDCRTFRTQENESEAALRKLTIVSLMGITFMIIEFFGGYFSGSMAVMTDAAHLLSDFSGFIISMFSVWIGSREASKRFSFGFHRAEVIGALVSVILIWGLTLVLVIEAIDRILHPVFVDGKMMLITAGLGLVFNLIMVKILHSPGNHSHHGGNHKNHSQENNIISYEMEDLGIQKFDFEKEQYNHNERLELKHYDSLNEPEIIFDLFSKSFDIQSNKLDIEKVDWANKSIMHSSIQTSSKDNAQFNSNRNVKNNSCCDKNHDHEEHQNLSETHHSHNHSHNSNAHSNLNVRAAAIHVLGDIIQSVGVLIAALLIYAFPKFQIIDPIGTFLFSILVIGTTYMIVKDGMLILMEGVPSNLGVEEVKSSLLQIKGVSAIQELNIWTLTAGKNGLTAKISGNSNNQILVSAHNMLREKYGIKKGFIEISLI